MEADNVLKEKLITPSILALSQANEKYAIDIDACNTQVGCVLLPERENKFKKPIRYYLSSPCDAEQRYDTTQKTFLTAV